MVKDWRVGKLKMIKTDLMSEEDFDALAEMITKGLGPEEQETFGTLFENLTPHQQSLFKVYLTIGYVVDAIVKTTTKDGHTVHCDAHVERIAGGGK